MQLPPGVGYMQAKFLCEGDPEPMMVGLGLRLTSSGDDVAQGVANAIPQFFAPFAQVMTSEYQCIGGVLRIGQDGGEPRVFESDGTSTWTGQQAAGVAPPNVAYLIRKNTSLGGRRNRGRMYIPGVPRTWFGPSGTFGPTQLASIQSACTGLLNYAGTGIGVNVSEWLILHSTGVSALPAPTKITSFTAQNKVATQRRRLRP